MSIIDKTITEPTIQPGNRQRSVKQNSPSPAATPKEQDTVINSVKPELKDAEAAEALLGRLLSELPHVEEKTLSAHRPPSEERLKELLED